MIRDPFTRIVLVALSAAVFAFGSLAQAKPDVKAPPPKQQTKMIQDIEKSMPPVVLVTKVDSKGLKQWDKTPARNCPACKGSKLEKCQHCAVHEKPEKCPECKLKNGRKAPCHYCAGKGRLFDELEWAVCPGCNGHSLFICYLCGNKGGISITGGSKKPQKCSSCKGEAGMPCKVCNGKRLVQSAFRGKVGQVKLAQLKQTKADVEKLISALQTFQCKGQPRTDRKEFAALFKDVYREFPSLKKAVALSEDVNKGLDAPYKDIEKQQSEAYKRFVRYILYYLVHQEKVIDLCIARLEANEKVKEGK